MESEPGLLEATDLVSFIHFPHGPLLCCGRHIARIPECKVSENRSLSVSCSQNNREGRQLNKGYSLTFVDGADNNPYIGLLGHSEYIPSVV